MRSNQTKGKKKVKRSGTATSALYSSSSKLADAHPDLRNLIFYKQHTSCRNTRSCTRFRICPIVVIALDVRVAVVMPLPSIFGVARTKSTGFPSRRRPRASKRLFTYVDAVLRLFLSIVIFIIFLDRNGGLFTFWRKFIKQLTSYNMYSSFWSETELLMIYWIGIS